MNKKSLAKLFQGIGIALLMLALGGGAGGVAAALTDLVFSIFSDAFERAALCFHSIYCGGGEVSFFFCCNKKWIFGG